MECLVVMLFWNKENNLIHNPEAGEKTTKIGEVSRIPDRLFDNFRASKSVGKTFLNCIEFADILISRF